MPLIGLIDARDRTDRCIEGRLIVNSIIADALPPRKSHVTTTPIDIPDVVRVPPPVPVAPDLKAF